MTIFYDSIQHNGDVSPESTEFVITMSKYEKKFVIYVQFILRKDQAKNLCFGSRVGVVLEHGHYKQGIQ